jgi:hypothetical protein
MLIAAGAGCGKSSRGKPTSGRLDAPPAGPEASGPLAPQRVLRDEVPDEQGTKTHLRLVVDAKASDPRIEELMRRVAEEERPLDGVLWISVFLAGMDVNSVAYAFGVAQPGQPLAIQHRESVQTYR